MYHAALETRATAVHLDTPRGFPWRSVLLGAAVVHLVSYGIVLLGLAAGLQGLLPAGPYGIGPVRVPLFGDPYVDALTGWDGQWYLKIVTTGYGYDPQRRSSVAFFPAFPVLVAMLHEATSLPPHIAGLVVSHAFLIGALVLLGVYAGGRCRGVGWDKRSAVPPEALPTDDGGTAEDGGTALRLSHPTVRARWFVLYTVLALALFPTSFFMRMVYTESLFLFLILLTFVAMQRGWPLPAIAIVAGTATATRSVGVALLLPLAWHVWEREKGDRSNLPERPDQPSVGTRCFAQIGPVPFFLRLAWLGPLAAWGLLAYIVFQWCAFDEPLAFVKTQQFWRHRPPEAFGETILALLAWEPVWSVYVPSLPGYWGSIDRGVWMPLSYQLANANLFVLAIGLVALGAAKKWLSVREVLLAAGLLGIPYAISGFRFTMGSQGRYVSVVFPIYLVLGQILCRLPVAASVAVLALSAAYLALFSAMLASGYAIY